MLFDIDGNSMDHMTQAFVYKLNARLKDQASSIGPSSRHNDG